MSPYFEYELTSFPTSLFTENVMRKAVQAQLAKCITDSVDYSEYRRQVLNVLDGGALLHRVKWGKKVISTNCTAVCVVCMGKVWTELCCF